MSTTDEMKAASTIAGYTPETQGVAAKRQPIASDESDRDGGPIQTRGPENQTPTKENNKEHYRDGGPLQTRDATTASSAKEDEAQTKGSSVSPDDVERGA